MPKGVKKNFKRPLPEVRDLNKKVEVPELPSTYKRSLWRTVRVPLKLTFAEETMHFINIMCLHFGVGRPQLLTHAINILWAEIVESVDPQRLKLYEDKLEAVRLWRLENGNFKSETKGSVLRDAIARYKDGVFFEDDRRQSHGVTWSYEPKRHVGKARLKRKRIKK